jgi:hypothetical protein
MDPLILQYVSLISITLLTSVITLFTGFGVGTIMMPVMALFFDVKVAIFLAAIVHFFNNISRILLYRRNLRRDILRRFGIVSVAGAFIGSFAQLYIQSAWLKSGVGIFLILFALASLLPFPIRWKFPPVVDVAGGLLSGLIGGLIGNQGAIRSLYLLNYRLDKQELIASAAMIAVVIDATRIPVYAVSNYGYLRENLTLMLLVILASIVGTMIGGRILPKVSYEFFRRIILVAVLGLGIMMAVGMI